MGDDSSRLDDVRVELERVRARVLELEAERALSASAAHGPSLQTLLDHLPDIVGVMDRDLRLIYLNRTVATRTVEEVLHRSALDFIPKADHRATIDAFSRAVETGAPQRVELESTSGFVWESRFVPLQKEGEIVAVMIIASDVTHRRQLEAQRRQAHKLEALGRVTAGIAHNFNNMLTVILTNLRLVLQQTTLADEPRLREAERAGQRAAEMVRELMVFARGRHSPSRMRRTDLVELARRTVAMCSASFGGIAAQFEVDGDLPHVQADSGRVEQALINILLNARDALAGQVEPLPHVWVRLDHVALLPSSGIASHKAARIQIRDNGPGIAGDLLSRVFEPFVSTKGVEHGTGLGLATAYATMIDHGGTITCESQPGAGATFTLLFPIEA